MNLVLSSVMRREGELGHAELCFGLQSSGYVTEVIFYRAIWKWWTCSHGRTASIVYFAKEINYFQASIFGQFFCLAPKKTSIVNALHEAEYNSWWHTFFNWIVTACAGGRVAETNVFRNNCFFNSRSAAHAQRISVYNFFLATDVFGAWRGIVCHHQTLKNIGIIDLFRTAPIQRVCAMSMRHWREALKLMLLHQLVWFLFDDHFISFHLEKNDVQLRKFPCRIGTMSPSPPLFICNHTPHATQQLAFQRLNRHFFWRHFRASAVTRIHPLQLMIFFV